MELPFHGSKIIEIIKPIRLSTIFGSHALLIRYIYCPFQYEDLDQFSYPLRLGFDRVLPSRPVRIFQSWTQPSK
jgi:hypothetical protein